MRHRGRKMYPSSGANYSSVRVHFPGGGNDKLRLQVIYTKRSRCEHVCFREEGCAFWVQSNQLSAKAEHSYI